MGICRSTCTSTSQLEYYDGWRTDQSMEGGRTNPVMISRGMNKRLNGGKRNTKVWMCDRGCCSIRWKLDYAEFQSYAKYAAFSPYVVVQEKNEECTCIICKGLPDQFLQYRLDQLDVRLAEPNFENTISYTLYDLADTSISPHITTSNVALTSAAMSPSA